jgi:hypothetical protein
VSAEEGEGICQSLRLESGSLAAGYVVGLDLRVAESSVEDKTSDGVLEGFFDDRRGPFFLVRRQHDGRHAFGCKVLQ